MYLELNANKVVLARSKRSTIRHEVHRKLNLVQRDKKQNNFERTLITAFRVPFSDSIRIKICSGRKL